MNFQENQSSLEVVQEIVASYKEIEFVKLILHDVGINWGQRYDTNSKIVAHLDESLVQVLPLEWKKFTRSEFLELKLENLTTTEQHQVWSFTSKVRLTDGSYRHIPMMNFHPLKGVSVEDILYFIRLIEPSHKAVLLESGRYFHYYGGLLLTEEDWLQFNAKFLMPMILVRSRYIGHRVRDGYSTLRLTHDNQFKPKIPRVQQLINC